MNKQVLYYAPYKNGSGYAYAAINYILAMDSVGINVKPINQPLISTNFQVPNRILELEKRKTEDVVAIVQHTLPKYMFVENGVKNIAVCATETDSIKYCNWVPRLNLMDQIWAISKYCVDVFAESGVTTPTFHVPHAHDISKFHHRHEKLKSLAQFNKDFLFYSIGEAIERKHYSSLLRGFLSEFMYWEPVKLVIKVSGEEQYERVTSLIDSTCALLQIKNAFLNNRIIVISDRLTDSQMMSLHASCDCFVQTSYGESWSIPAMDALGMKKTPIVTGWSGYTDYIDNENGWLLNYTMEPASTAGNQNLYTFRERWASVDIEHLRKCMREAYSGDRISKQTKAAQTLSKYSFKSIGSLIEKIL